MIGRGIATAGIWASPTAALVWGGMTEIGPLIALVYIAGMVGATAIIWIGQAGEEGK